MTRQDRRQAPQIIDLGMRTPPHAADVEAAVIAAVLADGRKVEDCRALHLEAEHFYGNANARILTAAYELQSKGSAVDLQTVAVWLKDREWLEAIGGITYLARLIDSTPAVAHLDAYIAIILDRARRRALIDALHLSTAAVFDCAVPFAETVDATEQAVFSIGRAESLGVQLVQVYDLARDVFPAIMGRRHGKRAWGGVPTGIRALDAITGGQRRKELFITAGRPSMGKTAFLVSLALGAAGMEVDDEIQGVVVFSLEQPKEQMLSRMLAARGKVNVRAYEKGEPIPEGTEDRLMYAAQAVSQLPIWIDDTPGITPLQARAAVRRLKSQADRPVERDADGNVTKKGFRISLVLIDYIQIMKPTSAEENREREVGSITGDLKALAKDLDVAVHAFAQLSRKVEERTDKRPQLSDLRESGSLEQDADVIAFLFRAHYYLKDKQSADAEKVKRAAEIIVAKQRNGPTDTVFAQYMEEFTLFSDRAAA